MFRLTGGQTLKETHRRHHHDVYCHASFGSAALACCVNYTLEQLLCNWKISIIQRFFEETLLKCMFQQ